ncbi:MAG: hypothetical protein JWM80_2159 [Cyanobacteria bacterium RYN_339]|nr:hypothetical protein [Cyanobacteria bacterium RYN_339]
MKQAANRHLESLYEISKVLTHIEATEVTLRAVIELVVQALPSCGAVAIVGAPGRWATTSWRAEGVDAVDLALAERRAHASLAYFVDGVPTVDAREALEGRHGPGPLIVLPLAVDARPVFGVLQIEPAGAPSEQDLMFVNAVVNQLAIGLDWHAAAEALRAEERNRTANAEARRATAEDLRERYEALVDNLDRALVWEADADSLEVSYVSGVAERLLGFPRADWTERPDFWVAQIHPDDRARVLATLRSVARGGGNQRCEYRFRAADGHTVWLHTGVHLEPKGRQLQGVSADITELKRAEATQRFYAEIGAVIDASVDYPATLEAIARLAVPEFASACWFELVEADGATQCFGAADPAGPHAERVPITARGASLGCLCFTPAIDSPGLEADRAVAEEVARRVGLAIENSRLFRKAEHDSRAREHVLAVVSHDLRNPLSAILTSVDLMGRPGDKPAGKAGQKVEIIRRSALEMERLICDLVDTASIEAGNFSLEQQVLEAATLVHDAVTGQQMHAAARSVALVGQVACEGTWVRCDRHRIRQVFWNLIGNAIKFTGSGGTIKVVAEPAVGGVRFSVSDTGAGMDAADLSHALEPFWRGATARGPGVGLGLAIAGSIIAAHGGKLGVESVPGEGTTAYFTLPTA